MLLRPAFVVGILLVFSLLCGYLFMNGLKENNAWSSALAILAIGCLVVFANLYHKLLITPPDDMERPGND